LELSTQERDQLPQETTKNRGKLFLDDFSQRLEKKITSKKNELSPLVTSSKSKPCSSNRDPVGAQVPRRIGERPGMWPSLVMTTNWELTRSGNRLAAAENESSPGAGNDKHLGTAAHAVEKDSGKIDTSTKAWAPGLKSSAERENTKLAALAPGARSIDSWRQRNPEARNGSTVEKDSASGRDERWPVLAAHGRENQHWRRALHPGVGIELETRRAQLTSRKIDGDQAGNLGIGTNLAKSKTAVNKPESWALGPRPKPRKMKSQTETGNEKKGGKFRSGESTHEMQNGFFHWIPRSRQVLQPNHGGHRHPSLV
jgi:hypothetical protein